MAGLFFRAVTGEISTGVAAKTLLQLIAAANHRVLLHGFVISFKGIAPTDAPIKVDVLRQTTAGTMSSLTLVKHNNGDNETLQTTAQHTATAEPTAGDVLDSFYVHPQGRREFTAAYRKETPILGGERLGIRVTAGVSVNAIVSADLEE